MTNRGALAELEEAALAIEDLLSALRLFAGCCDQIVCGGGDDGEVAFDIPIKTYRKARKLVESFGG